MKIYLKELTEQEKILEFTEKDDWVAQAVHAADEHEQFNLAHADADPSQPTPRGFRPISVRFSFRKVDEVVVLSGDLEADIELVCSRCATRFKKNSSPHFEALFCKDPVMAGVGYLQRTDSTGESKPHAQNHGYARHAHNADEENLADQGKDLDITYLSHDFIELDAVITEQLQFQIPFQPLCQEDCKGICSQCGTDLNHNNCKCVPVNLPFAMLRDFKISTN